MGSEETSGARQAEHGRGSTMNTVLMVALGVVAGAWALRPALSVAPPDAAS